MKFTRTLTLVMILAAGAVAGARAQDATLNVTPGKYMIKKETSSNMKPEPVIKTEEKCISEPVFKPEDALPDKESCSVSNVKKDGDTLTFDIDCKGGAQTLPMKGTAEYSVTSSTISWSIMLKGEMQGKEVTINSKAEGKRMGDCHEAT